MCHVIDLIDSNDHQTNKLAYNHSLSLSKIEIVKLDRRVYWLEKESTSLSIGTIFLYSLLFRVILI